MISIKLDELLQNGYCKLALEDLESLEKIRRYVISLITKNNLNSEADPVKLRCLSELHQTFKSPDINDLRLQLIDNLNAAGNFNQSLMVRPLPEFISNAIGDDQVIQRNVNLVIQRPGDVDNSELHRDFPGNSAFELVVWIPLVDCSKDMSMYLLDFDNSIKVAQKIAKGGRETWSLLEEIVEKYAVEIPVDFGEALVFMTPLFHGSRINRGEKTRVSFNFRLKNMFSPSGMRDSYAFWSVFRLSKFTKKILDEVYE